ncbi:MAG: exonuclease SbcC, partial [Caulobacteraceae bacterium]|nr:exonuclease SbcC [Caulobacteraceae bacterium]
MSDAPDPGLLPPLSQEDLRAVVAFAAACARPALALFETACPDDPRPRAAIEAAQAFAGGERRTQALRLAALAALRAGREA